MTDEHLERAVADLGERIARHVPEVREHASDPDGNCVTVVELAPSGDAPRVHAIPRERWRGRTAARGRALHAADAGVYVVERVEFGPAGVVVWGLWPGLFGDGSPSAE